MNRSSKILRLYIFSMIPLSGRHDNFMEIPNNDVFELYMNYCKAQQNFSQGIYLLFSLNFLVFASFSLDSASFLLFHVVQFFSDTVKKRNHNGDLGHHDMYYHRKVHFADDVTYYPSSAPSGNSFYGHFFSLN